VGSLEESVTVSGQAPQVDVQQASRVTNITRDIIDTLPVSRNMPRCAENAYSLSGTLWFWSAAQVEAIHTPCVLACVSAEPGAGRAAGPSSP